MMSLYSWILQSSATSKMIGRTNGIILLFLNSSPKIGMTLCSTSRYVRERWREREEGGREGGREGVGGREGGGGGGRDGGREGRRERGRERENVSRINPDRIQLQ